LLSADFDPAHLRRACVTRAMPGDRDRRSHDEALVRRGELNLARYRSLGAGVWEGSRGRRTTRRSGVQLGGGPSLISGNSSRGCGSGSMGSGRVQVEGRLGDEWDIRGVRSGEEVRRHGEGDCHGHSHITRSSRHLEASRGRPARGGTARRGIVQQSILNNKIY